LKTRKKGFYKNYVEPIAVALLAALILRAFVIQAFRIPTGSMKDTLLVGDFLLVNKFIYGAQSPERIPIINAKLPSFRLPALKKPERGEVIVFKYPLDPTMDYIKRCMGLPGDTIELKDGIVYINGQVEGERKFVKKAFDISMGTYVNYYQITTPAGLKYTIRNFADREPRYANFGPVVVPPNSLFMMGDNRDNSQDSREWGFMPMKNIVGRALVIYWSWDKGVPLWNLGHKIRWDRIFGVIR
jgi:signal peptidase I